MSCSFPTILSQNTLKKMDFQNIVLFDVLIWFRESSVWLGEVSRELPSHARDVCHTLINFY